MYWPPCSLRWPLHTISSTVFGPPSCQYPYCHTRAIGVGNTDLRGSFLRYHVRGWERGRGRTAERLEMLSDLRLRRLRFTAVVVSLLLFWGKNDAQVSVQLCMI